MKSLTLLIILAMLCLPVIGLGASYDLPLGVAVKFDKSFYDLEFGREFFKYSESGRVYGIKIKDCNRSKVAEVEKTYQSLLKNYSNQMPRQRTKYDVEVSSSGKKFAIARGSEFGTWLREMPKKIMYLNAETRALCKR